MSRANYSSYYEVRDYDGALRFSGIYLQDCIEHVNRVYKRTARPKEGVPGIICSIRETQRESK